MVNLHFSLLPRWRGAAPVERALLAGDDETGVCLMQLEEGLDTGPVFAASRGADRADARPPPSCGPSWCASAPTLLVGSSRRGSARPVPQAGEPTYAAKIDPGRARHRLAPPGRRAGPARAARRRLDRRSGVSG